jgi:Flp pilus assembly protein CpaB
LVAIGLAVAVASTVADRVATAVHVRRSWGSTATVLVARQDLPPGTQLRQAHFRQATWPAALVPDDPVAELDPRARLRHPVGRGEVLVAARLDTTGRGELAAQLGPDERDVRVRLEVPMRGLAVEDLVDVVQVTDPLLADPLASGGTSSTAGTVPITRRARVLQVGDDAATLAVGAADAAAVASPGATAGVTLVIRR